MTIDKLIRTSKLDIVHERLKYSYQTYIDTNDEKLKPDIERLAKEYARITGFYYTHRPYKIEEN